MSTPPHGHYPIESRAGEIERLELQGEAIAAEAAVMLDRIGVAAGWRCLDLGCGPGGITDLLAERVGPTGRVVGLDADAMFIDYARRRARERGSAQVDFITGDAYATTLAGDSFDLVHSRFVASTAGQPAKLLAEAIRLARPGGVVALQEPDIATLKCYPPHPAWDRLVEVLEAVFVKVGSDVRLAQRLYPLLRAARLEDVQYRPFLVGFRWCDRMAGFLPQTIAGVRGKLLEHGLIAEPELDAALAACSKHLADPDTVFTYPTVAQAWGRKPRMG